MDVPRDAPSGDLTRTPVQVASLVVGLVFLLIGVAGFIPGITTNYDQMQFAGHESEALLLGIFAVSVLHNIVHLGFGVWGLAAARSFTQSSTFLVWGGVLYGVLWIYGLLIDKDSAANFVPVNVADDWLHFALAIAMIGLGLWLGRGTRSDRARGA